MAIVESESSELLDVSSYEGGNMLHSTIFRTSDIRWTSANLDMREGKAFGHRPSLEVGPCRRGFHVPSEEERGAVMDVLEELNLSENINETLLLPKAGKKTGLNTDVDVGDEGYYLARIPNADGTANVFHPTAEGGEILQMAIKNAVSVRGFRNIPIVPTTDWEIIIPGGESPRLPLAYQEVAYIQSTGTQYITTSIIPSDTKGIYIKISSQDVSNDLLYIGSRKTTDTRFRIGNSYDSSISSGRIYIGWNTNDYYTMSANTIYEVELNYLNSKSKKVNGTSVANSIGTLSSSNNIPITIFAGNENGTIITPSSIKLYSCKISDGSNIINDFVPCYRRIDGAVGLYDLVNDQFYANAGSGTFLKGADVRVPSLPQGYTEVEYLQSNGNQYIDTLIDRNEILTPFIRYDFYSDTLTADGGFLGYWATGGYIFGVSSNQYRFTAGGTAGWSSSGIAYSTGRHVFTTNASNWYLDGVQGAGNGGNMTIYTGTLHLFRAGGGFGVPNGNVRVYSFILGSSLTELLHYFVPCARNQDGKPGFYDLITKQFYVNNGTGEFTYGGDMVRGYKNNEYTILYWPLSGASNDVSGFRNDGTAGSISYSLTDGIKAASFVSGSSNIYTDNSFVANCNGTQQFTYALWFKIGVMPASGKTYEFGWCGKTGYSSCDKLFRIASDGSINCYNYVSQSYAVTAPAGTVTTNTWYCMVYTYDGVKVRVYLNKELVGEVAAPGSYNYSSVGGGRFILGRINGDTVGFQGYVGDVVIENIGRGEGWVNEYYSSTCSRYTERKGLSMRYIRNSMSGNNLNTSNHWVEIEAMNGNTNVALHKTVTLVSGTFEANDINRIVDGDKVADNYYSTRNGAATIQIDLGQIYNINEINMRHFFADSRYYYSNNLQASPDGVNWTTLFDSNITGTYNESSAGKTVLL